MPSPTPQPTSGIFDVLVVGAGPTGLAAALLAAQSGRSTALIAPPAPPDARTSALLGGSVALLERLGLWDELASEAAPLRHIRLVDATERLIRAPEVAFASSEIDLDAFGYNIPNTPLVKALAEAVGDAGVHLVPAAVEALNLRDAEAEAVTAEGSPVRGRLVVAADGRNSRSREAAGIKAHSWRYDQSALVLNLSHTLPHGDASTEFHTEAGPFTLVPLPGKRSSLVWVARPSEAARLAALPDEELARAIERQSRSLLGRIEIDGRKQVFPLSGMGAERMTGKRVALIGEAAHVLPPIGAQGLNLGFRDVADLAPLLEADDPGSIEALTGYERRRRGDVALRTQAIDMMNRTLLSGFLPVQAARGVGLFLLDRVPALRRAAMRQGMAAPDGPRLS